MAKFGGNRKWRSFLRIFFIIGQLFDSLLHSRYTTLLHTMGGALRDNTKNGCVADYKLFDVFYDPKIYFQTANFVSMCIIKKETEIFRRIEQHNKFMIKDPKEAEC